VITAGKKHWPLDLKIFAMFLVAWSLFLLMIAITVNGDFVLVDPLQAIVNSALFSLDSTRMVLILEAGIFGVIGAGILAEQKWGLVFALIYMAQIVINHLAFALTHLSMRFELSHVRHTAMQGPVLVLITLYLWIRTTELVFDAAPASSLARIRENADQQDRAAVRAGHATGELGIAGSQK
jgi:hypothetical protein